MEQKASIGTKTLEQESDSLEQESNSLWGEIRETKAKITNIYKASEITL